jgi:copper resistance protein C
MLLAVGSVAAVPMRVVPHGATMHTRLLRSDPAADATVPAPAAVRLWFSERVELSLTGLTLTGPTGTARTVRATRADMPDAPVVVAVAESLRPGAYTVAWRTASRDGHPVKGRFRFTVTSGR